MSLLLYVSPARTTRHAVASIDYRLRPGRILILVGLPLDGVPPRLAGTPPFVLPPPEDIAMIYSYP